MKKTPLQFSKSIFACEKTFQNKKVSVFLKMPFFKTLRGNDSDSLNIAFPYFEPILGLFRFGKTLSQSAEKIFPTARNKKKHSKTFPTSWLLKSILTIKEHSSK